MSGRNRAPAGSHSTLAEGVNTYTCTRGPGGGAWACALAGRSCLQQGPAHVQHPPAHGARNSPHPPARPPAHTHRLGRRVGPLPWPAAAPARVGRLHQRAVGQAAGRVGARVGLHPGGHLRQAVRLLRLVCSRRQPGVLRGGERGHFHADAPRRCAPPSPPPPPPTHTHKHARTPRCPVQPHDVPARHPPDQGSLVSVSQPSMVWACLRLSPDSSSRMSRSSSVTSAHSGGGGLPASCTWGQGGGGGVKGGRVGGCERGFQPRGMAATAAPALAAACRAAGSPCWRQSGGPSPPSPSPAPAAAAPAPAAPRSAPAASAASRRRGRAGAGAAAGPPQPPQPCPSVFSAGRARRLCLLLLLPPLLPLPLPPLAGWPGAPGSAGEGRSRAETMQGRAHATAPGAPTPLIPDQRAAAGSSCVQYAAEARAPPAHLQAAWATVLVARGAGAGGEGPGDRVVAAVADDVRARLDARHLPGRVG